ncbi:hypothetical protein BDW66DRAFT_152194 [Aspergillus desertorum]
MPASFAAFIYLRLSLIITADFPRLNVLLQCLICDLKITDISLARLLGRFLAGATGMAACMTTTLHPVLAHLAVLLTLHLEAPQPTKDATTPEAIPAHNLDTEVEIAMTFDDDLQGHLRGAHDTTTAIAIAKTIARPAEVEVTVAAKVEARAAAGHITDKRAERS